MRGRDPPQEVAPDDAPQTLHDDIGHAARERDLAGGEHGHGHSWVDVSAADVA